MTVEIRPLVASDRADWAVLYAAYAEFYGVGQTDAMRARVWDWLMDPTHEVCGFVAVLGGAVVGIAHVRPFARPLAAATGGYLDDLFVSPEARGTGAAAALIEAIKAEGAERGWSVIRWITAEDNARARALYDKLATATAWVTYDLTI